MCLDASKGSLFYIRNLKIRDKSIQNQMLLQSVCQTKDLQAKSSPLEHLNLTCNSSYSTFWQEQLWLQSHLKQQNRRRTNTETFRLTSQHKTEQLMPEAANFKRDVKLRQFFNECKSRVATRHSLFSRNIFHCRHFDM